MTQEIMEKTINGVNVDQLFKTIDMIKENPEIARFKFRATNKWINGTHCRGTIKDFYGAMQEDDFRPPMHYDMDEPPVLLGNNEGRNPVEYLLVALSGCLTTTLIAHSSARGIEIRGVRSRYEGDLDLRGFLGLSEEVPVGYQDIRVYFTIDADVSEEKKLEMIKMAQKYSPVFNTVTRAPRSPCISTQNDSINTVCGIDECPVPFSMHITPEASLRFGVGWWNMEPILKRLRTY